MRAVFRICLMVVLLPSILGTAFAEWPPPWLKKKETAPPVFPRILIEATELADSLKREDWFAIDARPKAAYLSRHVPGAHFMDVRSMGGVEGVAGSPSREIPSRHPVFVCYCDRSDPTAAGELFWILESMGLPNVRVLNGGIDAWAAAGLPTRCTAEGPVPRELIRFSAGGDTSRVAGYFDVRSSFGRPGITILDTRGDSLWNAGHIPHSLPFNVSEAVDETGRIADGPTVRSLFAAIGPRPNEYIDLNDAFIVPAGPETKGLAAHPYLLARVAGLDSVQCYAEGFQGWASHADAPVVRIVDAAHVRKLVGHRWAPGSKDRPSRDFILLDLRIEGDFERGHLPGAVCISPEEFQAKFESLVAKKWGAVDRRKIPVVFYCYGPGCIRSRNCSTWAAQMGFQNLEWFRDGTLGWRQLGEELVK